MKFQPNSKEAFLLSYIFGYAPKPKRKSMAVTEYKVIETFTGKKELKEALADLLCSAYTKEKRSFSQQKIQQKSMQKGVIAP